MSYSRKDTGPRSPDVLLSHGYFLAEDETERRVMKPYPTLGILYISSHLKAKGFSVETFDSTFASFSDFEDRLRDSAPRMLGLYTNLMTKANVLRMIRVAQRKRIPVVLGGPEAVNYPEAYLQAGADAVVIGEGEQTLEELLPRLDDRATWRDVAGLVYLEESTVVRSAPRQKIANLSKQPWPDREAIEFQQYIDVWRRKHGGGSVSLITARGCPFTCTWCSHSVYGRSHRRRSVEDVASEVEWIIDRYRPDQLWYADDVLTINRTWFLDYASELSRRGVSIPYEAITRADCLDEETVEALAATGAWRIWIGAESGSQRILDAMRRKTFIGDVRRKTLMLQTKGIKVGMFIMFGYEGEEETDLLETLEHLKTTAPDVFLTTVAYPIKGTEYYDAVQEHIGSDLPWQHRSDRDYRIAGRRSRRYYSHVTRWITNEVQAARSRQNGNLSQALWCRAKAGAGRIGMALTRNELETDAGGRPWTSKERAENAW